MKKINRKKPDPSDPSFPMGKAYYNGTPQSVEWILEQYQEKNRPKQDFLKNIRICPERAYTPFCSPWDVSGK
jgi:hypothetical protein